jgi:PST family polysaccharide transporter
LTIHNYADALLLDKLSTPQEVSAFGAGLRILTAIIFLPTVFSAVLGPRVTQAIVRNDHSKIRSLVGMSMRLIAFAAFLIGLFFTGAPAIAIRLLFGSDKYMDAIPIITIFGWTFLPIAFATFLGEIAIAEGKLWLSTMYMGIIMIVSVGMDLLLIPSMGAIGAAWAKCVAVSVGAIVLFIASKRMDVFDEKQFFFFLLKGLLSVALALVCLKVVAPLIHGSELLATSLCVIVFLAVAFGTKAVQYYELRSLLSGSTEKGGAK